MSERKNDPIGLLGDRLDAAFAQAESAGRKKRWQRPALALAAVAVVASVVWSTTRSFDGNRVFTIQEAIAEVQAGGFELPDPGENKMLFTEQETMWTAGGGTTTRSGKRMFSNQLITVRRESWTNPSRAGATRTSFIDAKFVSEQDEAMAKLMQQYNDRESRRMERARKRRGDRRPVPRFPVANPPYTVPDENGEPKSAPLVCPTRPSRGWVALDGDLLTPDEVKKLPTDSKALYERAFRATRGFRKNVDRSRWVWGTIRWALGSGAEKLTPAQRRAMVGAIAYVPGVRTLGETEDPLGRKTIGFVRDGRGQRDELFFDPNTSLPIYEQSINTAKRKRGRAETWPVGSVFAKTVIHETKIVDRVPATVKPKKRAKAMNGLLMCPPLK